MGPLADPVEGIPGLVVVLWLCTLHALPVLVLDCGWKPVRLETGFRTSPSL
jgi:hypothetical protein